LWGLFRPTVGLGAHGMGVAGREAGVAGQVGDGVRAEETTEIQFARLARDEQAGLADLGSR
jgi:hypothetical protein